MHINVVPTEVRGLESSGARVRVRVVCELPSGGIGKRTWVLCRALCAVNY